jgi:Domain of unknown function (DUF4411)
MIYLLDASVLITAQHNYYPIDQVPEFWDWLQHMGKIGRVKMPLEIYEEIKDGPKDTEKDRLFVWIQDNETRSALLFDEDVDILLVRKVVDNGYANDLTDVEIEQIGRDPFLVAYAMNGNDRCVVTTEASKPSKKRQNRHLPDVCNTMNVLSCDTFALNKTLGFSTNWKKN